MTHNILEFEYTGLHDGGKFPIENTGRGKDISPEFTIQKLLYYLCTGLQTEFETIFFQTESSKQGEAQYNSGRKNLRVF